MKIPYEDTYFLDPDMAYQTALAHNTVVLKDGSKLEQVCYYDGKPFGHAPDNLVNVPADEFSHYFQTHNNRIPTRVDFTAARRHSDAENLQKRYHNLLSIVRKMREKQRSG